MGVKLWGCGSIVAMFVTMCVCYVWCRSSVRLTGLVRWSAAVWCMAV